MSPGSFGIGGPRVAESSKTEFSVRYDNPVNQMLEQEKLEQEKKANEGKPKRGPKPKHSSDPNRP